MPEYNIATMHSISKVTADISYAHIALCKAMPINRVALLKRLLFQISRSY